MNRYPQAQKADIGLLLEGSYPFVLGGVSQWVHQLIERLPQYSFALIYLGSTSEKLGKICYPLARNVVHLQLEYLFPQERPLTCSKIKNYDLDSMKELHEKFRNSDGSNGSTSRCEFAFTLDSIDKISSEQFLFSKQSWDFIVEQYTKYCEDPSFIDYFWTIKNIHQPLWQLSKIVKKIPDLKLVHSISTGYAGLLGVLLNQQTGCPLVLSEHGIYTKERRIDILQSEIVRDYSLVSNSVNDISYLRDLWNRYFATLGRICYQTANPIISLFKAANQLQIEDGADGNKTLIIPNGINIERIKNCRREFSQKKNLVGFIGRLVPIKDIKDFIRAIALINQQYPDFQFWIIGADDEDPEYAQECRELSTNLGLTESIEFKPFQKIEDLFPLLKLVVLTSISEGMPLIMLESFAAGIPVVATDVGSCKELIEGKDSADQAIGLSGKVVQVADTQGIANAIIELMTEPLNWQQASQAGIKRVTEYYDEKTMLAKYNEIYVNLIK